MIISEKMLDDEIAELIVIKYNWFLLPTILFEISL